MVVVAVAVQVVVAVAVTAAVVVVHDVPAPWHFETTAPLVLHCVTLSAPNWPAAMRLQ